IMALHPHSCLTCNQRSGCLTLSADCSNSVVLNERCCELNGNCELQRLSDYIGIAPETPKYHHLGIPRIEDEGLFIRVYNLCISCGRCVRACQQLRNVYALGAVINNGKLVVGTVGGKHLSESDCRFCGACVEVCPTGAIQDKRKPRLKETLDYLPCRTNCPGDTDIPAYLRFIAEGNPQASAEVISSKLSFPHSLGKVCFHPCEVECRRNNLSGAINIRGAKDYAMSNSVLAPPQIMKDSGKKVSIIGAGPAGLTAGFYLALKGHKVIVYEKEEKPGGMLRYGIPRYRLPEESLLKDLNWLLLSGMEIKYNTKIGDKISISSLLENGSDAVYLASGLPISRRLQIEIPECESIFYGVEFLASVAKGKLSQSYFSGKEVIVVGGGNVASDAARTALRLGAVKTTMICLEQRDEMPAYKQEIDEALEEGIIINNSWGINNVTDNGHIKLNLIKCVSVFDIKGNFSPQYDESEKGYISADSVIFCIGQGIDLTTLTSEENHLINRGLIQTKFGSYKTSIEGLFAGGDVVSGPKSVIDAIGAAKQAAREIDLFVGGDGVISGDEKPEIIFDSRIGKIADFYSFGRIPQKMEVPQNRKSNFGQIEFCYDDDSAKSETRRCLQCNLRMRIRQNPYPPEKYFEFNTENIQKIKSEEGVIQLLNSEKEVFLIKGSDNMQDTLLGFFNEGKEAKFFIHEADPLFSKRESELIQQYLQKHGEMPDSGDDLDDLF
ncbi:MAG: FAD-dependent oxidoreductase, partial [Bacteroidota bacterium]